MDKVIAGIAKVLRDSEQSLATCLREICDVLQDHEKRLQKFDDHENDNLIDSLMNLAPRIEAMSDPAKRDRARAAFTELCEGLGVEPPGGGQA